MAISWDSYSTMLNINGSTQRERNLNCLQEKITNNLPDSLSYKNVLINNLVQNVSMTKTTNKYIKEINSLPNETFNCGDYLAYKTKDFLITDVDTDNEVYTQGKITQCNWTLKFQSPDGTILSYPCIDSNTLGDEEENKTITVGDSTKKITIGYNENTISLDNGRRFFIDRNTVKPKSYEIIGIDSTSKNYGEKGLIIFTMKECTAENMGELPDRIDLGICNYFEPIIPTPIPVGETYAKITISGDLTVGGSARTLNVVMYNADNTINTTVLADWQVVLPVGYEGYFTETDVAETNKHTIKVADNDDLIGLVVVANVSDGLGGFKDTMTLEVKLSV